MTDDGQPVPTAFTLQAGTEPLPARDDIAPPQDSADPLLLEAEQEGETPFVSTEQQPQPAQSVVLPTAESMQPGGSYPGQYPTMPVTPLVYYWTYGPVPFKTSRENLLPTATFGYDETLPILRLRNRRAMVSSSQYPNGVAFSFQWRWVGGTEQNNYPDVLTVVFRTDGQQRAARSWEIQSGLAVKFYRSHIEVLRYNADAASPIRLALRTDLNFPQGTFQQITITERNDSIAIRYGPGQNDVLTVNNAAVNEGSDVAAEFPPRTDTMNRIAIYNREPVAGYAQESRIAPPGDGADTMLRALPRAQCADDSSSNSSDNQSSDVSSDSSSTVTMPDDSSSSDNQSSDVSSDSSSSEIASDSSSSDNQSSDISDSSSSDESDSSSVANVNPQSTFPDFGGF